MSATLDTAVANLLAAHVRATMTPDESRYAHDERYNVFLALDLDDPDVLYVMGSRAIARKAKDIEAFTAGYVHALIGGLPNENAGNESFPKGYDAGRETLRAANSVGESSPSASVEQRDSSPL
ncbi:MAG: hypothetical protein ACR2JW_08665 [Thermomicrobiales bacterium]